MWQVVQTVLELTNVWVEGCAPTTQEPQEGIANALPANIAGNAKADAKTRVFMVFIDFMLPPKRLMIMYSLI